MTRFSRRLARDLDQIAAHVAPAADDWDRIRDLVDQEPNKPNEEGVMLELNDQPLEGRRQWTTLGLIGAAAVVLVAVITIRLIATDDDEFLASTSEDAEALIDQYVDAFNSGDVDRALGLFASDAMLTDGDADSSSSLSMDGLEALLTWYAAQDARISDAECRTIETFGEDSKVRCEWRVGDAVTKAIGQPGDLVAIDWTVRGGRIASFDRVINWSVRPHTSFIEWLSMNHPDDYNAFFVRPPFELSTKDAEDAGEIAAMHAPKWATIYTPEP